MPAKNCALGFSHALFLQDAVILHHLVIFHEEAARRRLILIDVIKPHQVGIKSRAVLKAQRSVLLLKGELLDKKKFFAPFLE